MLERVCETTDAVFSSVSITRERDSAIMATTDCVAPPVGTHTLETPFRELRGCP